MAKKTVEMLYIGKDSGELKQNSIIKVDMVEVKDDEGKVVDHKLPASLVGRVKAASQVSDGENPLQAENDELKAENDELKAENDELKAENDELKAENDELKAENDELKAKAEELEKKLAAATKK